MKIEQTWTASSADQRDVENADLSGLVGMWSTQVRVSINNPACIHEGPIEVRLERDTTDLQDEVDVQTE